VGDQRNNRVLNEIVAMLRDVTGEDEAWSGRITDATPLEDDLRLDSIELAALGERMRDRYGDDVDLVGFLAGLDLDEIIALTVGDLVSLVVGARSEDAVGAGLER
jgi:acyl carrier protein